MPENIDITRENQVGLIEIDTTTKHNSINPDFLSELNEAAKDLNASQEIRAITLTGKNDVYCSGLDLSILEGERSDADELEDIVKSLHNAIIELVNSPKPVITGINGVAAGGGFSLALIGDIVAISSDARLDYAYDRIGLTLDGGASYFLPRIVGVRKAMEIALLEGEIRPEEAMDLGLANKELDGESFDEELMELSREIARGPTSAYGKIKRLLHESYYNDLRGQLDLERHEMVAQTATEDYTAGINGFHEREEPEFPGK